MKHHYITFGGEILRDSTTNPTSKTKNVLSYCTQSIFFCKKLKICQEISKTALNYFKWKAKSDFGQFFPEADEVMEIDPVNLSSDESESISC